MMYRILVATLLGIALVIMFGCGKSHPLTPDSKIPEMKKVEIANQQRLLWGLWDVELDASTGSVEVTNLRSATFNANVVRFLQPPIAPINLLSIKLAPGSDIRCRGRSR